MNSTGQAKSPAALKTPFTKTFEPWESLDSKSQQHPAHFYYFPTVGKPPTISLNNVEEIVGVKYEKHHPKWRSAHLHSAYLKGLDQI